MSMPPPVHRPARGTSGTGVGRGASDSASLRALVPEWEALAADAAEPSPFYEHWMLLPALEAYGGEDFRCFAVWDNGTLIEPAPDAPQPRFRGLPVSALRSWRHRNMLLCTAPDPAKSMVRVVEALLQVRAAPLIEFDWVAAGGLFYGALAESASAAGLPWMVTDAYARALLVRDRDPRERFNSNMKNNLRRWQARLEPPAGWRRAPAAGRRPRRVDRRILAARGERLEGPRRQRARLPRGRPALRRGGVRRGVPPRAAADHRPRPRRQAAGAPHAC